MFSSLGLVEVRVVVGNLKFLLISFLLLNAAGSVVSAQMVKPSESGTPQIKIHFLGEYSDKKQKLHKVYIAEETHSYLGHLGDDYIIKNLIDVSGKNYMLVDPGPDRKYAESLLNHIHDEIKSKRRYPELIVDSAAKPESVLANASVSTRGTKILATPITQDFMREHCPQCRIRLSDLLQDQSIKKSAIHLPNTQIKNGEEIPHYEQWVVFEFAARTGSDLVLWNETLGIAYVGGLVSYRTIPNLTDASMLGWINALEFVKKLHPKIVIGARGNEHGLNDLEDIDRTLSYFKAIKAMVSRDLEADGNAANADVRLELTEFSDYFGYAKNHPLNVQHVWRDVEQEEMDINASEKP